MHAALFVVPSPPGEERFSCISTHIRQPGSLSAICTQNSFAAGLPRIPGRFFPAGAKVSGSPVASENARS